MTIHNNIKKLGLNSDSIKSVKIRTHEACIRIIDKKGPLNNPADRDHCIQYMVAVPLIFGRLTASDYEDAIAKDKRIDQLRNKISCVEDKKFTRDYHDPNKRSIANALTVTLTNGKPLKKLLSNILLDIKEEEKMVFLYSLRSLKEILVGSYLKKTKLILKLCNNQNTFENTDVNVLVDHLSLS